MQSLLQGLPITARSQQYSQPSQLSQLISAGVVEGGAQGVSGLYNMLFGGGDTSGYGEVDIPTDPYTEPYVEDDFGDDTAEEDGYA